ncbi:cell division protein FtsW [Patescibacteria group bacterium]|nr:cell division protein FtsW [Patescibacteria group bacterium]
MKAELHQPDQTLLISFVILVVLGLLVLSSASYFIACQKFNDCYFYLKHQLLFGLLPGAIFFLFFSVFNYQNLKKLALPLLILTIFLLGIVFIPGVSFARGEAQRWVKIFGIVVQPSEIAKLTFIIYLSAWLAKNQESIKSFKQVFFPFVLLLIIICFLIISQPDLGTLIVIVSSALVIYFIAGAPLPQVSFLIIGLFSLLVVSIKVAPYRLARIMAFLHPEIDPQGIGYHINQAILAISSGRILGRGLGYSSQKIYHLPEVVSDSIFAVMAEELGFILMAGVVILYIYLTYRIFRLAGSTNQVFGKLLAAGIGFWFIFQSIVNMGAMLGILPLTGIPLPLIGYGGSNFCVFLAAFGILVNISRQTPLKKSKKNKNLSS